MFFLDQVGGIQLPGNTQYVMPRYPGRYLDKSFVLQLLNQWCLAAAAPHIQAKHSECMGCTASRGASAESAVTVSDEPGSSNESHKENTSSRCREQRDDDEVDDREMRVKGVTTVDILIPSFRADVKALETMLIASDSM
jgi:hypothetical protein